MEWWSAQQTSILAVALALYLTWPLLPLHQGHGPDLDN